MPHESSRPELVREAGGMAGPDLRPGLPSALAVPAVLDSLHAIGQFVTTAAAAAGLEKRAAYRLRLAVDELATNVVVHGFGHDAPDERIALEASLGGDRLVLTIEDAAPAFDPTQRDAPTNLDMALEERPIGGLGVYLALEGVDEFRYERVGERNRSILIMNRAPAA